MLLGIDCLRYLNDRCVQHCPKQVYIRLTSAHHRKITKMVTWTPRQSTSIFPETTGHKEIWSLKMGQARTRNWKRCYSPQRLTKAILGIFHLLVAVADLEGGAQKARSLSNTQRLWHHHEAVKIQRLAWKVSDLACGLSRRTIRRRNCCPPGCRSVPNVASRNLSTLLRPASVPWIPTTCLHQRLGTLVALPLRRVRMRCLLQPTAFLDPVASNRALHAGCRTPLRPRHQRWGAHPCVTVISVFFTDHRKVSRRLTHPKDLTCGETACRRNLSLRISLAPLSSLRSQAGSQPPLFAQRNRYKTRQQYQTQRPYTRPLLILLSRLSDRHAPHFVLTAVS